VTPRGEVSVQRSVRVTGPACTARAGVMSSRPGSAGVQGQQDVRRSVGDRLSNGGVRYDKGVGVLSE